MALRIFEPRYVRMIKQSCSSNEPFAICMLNSAGDTGANTHIFGLGTLCKVIDFDMLEDGLLGVTVEGVHCIKVSNITSEEDGLRIGDCELLDPWQCDLSEEELYPMDARLKEIFDMYPEVSSLYDATHFDDPIWIINRWFAGRRRTKTTLLIAK